MRKSSWKNSLTPHRSRKVQDCKHSNKEFDMEDFQQTTIKPFLSSLIEEIENAFDIPHL